MSDVLNVLSQFISVLQLFYEGIKWYREKEMIKVISKQLFEQVSEIYHRLKKNYPEVLNSIAILPLLEEDEVVEVKEVFLQIKHDLKKLRNIAMTKNDDFKIVFKNDWLLLRPFLVDSITEDGRIDIKQLSLAVERVQKTPSLRKKLNRLIKRVKTEEEEVGKSYSEKWFDRELVIKELCSMVFSEDDKVDCFLKDLLKGAKKGLTNVIEVYETKCKKI